MPPHLKPPHSSHPTRTPSAAPIGRLRSRARAGFTLIELMVVVVIITVLATLAIPTVVNRMRDRRVQAAAQHVASLYQQARMRAMARGGAVYVRYSEDERGRIDVREAQRGPTAIAGCESLPVASCAVDWGDDNASGEYREVTFFDLEEREEYGTTTEVQMLDGAGNVLSQLEVCFTPMGRTFARADPNQPFAPLAQVYNAEVFRTGGSERIGLTRNVLVLPSGIARLR